MPNVLKKALFIFFFGLVFGFSVTHLISEISENASRDLASSKGPKLRLDMNSKSLATISVSLNEPTEIPLDTEETVEITGQVVLRHGSPSDLHLKWQLPAGVVSTESLQAVISNAQPGVIYPIQLHVQGFNKVSKKNVTVMATANVDGVEYGNSSLISSRPEDSWEYVAPAMSDAAADAEVDTAPQESTIIR